MSKLFNEIYEPEQFNMSPDAYRRYLDGELNLQAGRCYKYPELNEAAADIINSTSNGDKTPLTALMELAKLESDRLNLPLN